MLKLFGFIKGILIQNESDRTKQLSLEVDSSASSGTTTSLKSKQTLNRNLTLPDVSGELVEKDATQVLTNKTIDGDNNTLQDISISSLKTVLADADKFIVRDVSGQVISAKAVPVGAVVGTSDTQTLTNKTIDADSNTITNIENADIKVGAAIDAAKIHDGSVSNTEFGYLSNVTSDIQSQIDAKAEIAGATDNRLVKTDGATDIQQTGITVDDSNNITGVNNLTVNGDLTVNGTTTTLNTATLDVEDQNITVNFNGNDATAQGAGFTVDRTGTSGSFVYDSVTSSKWKAGDLGSEIEVVTISHTQSLSNKLLSNPTNILTGAKSNSFERQTGNQQSVTIPDVASADTFVTQAHPQVLTNKDYDGGVASNSRRITVPQDTLANLLALTRKEGTLLYANDTDKFYLDDGSTLKEVGSGAGEVNFISNGDAEANTNGWVTYADAAATRPVDGTGGSPSVTFTRSTTSPLSGQASFLFSKDAVNRQGQGASYDFSIDLANRAKVLKISFDYLVNSGTFVAGTNSADSDLIVYLYDVTNARLLEPSSIKLFSNSTTISDSYEATFQTNPDSSNYRLILHCASTSALAYVLKIDNVKVSPSSYVFGTPITDWRTYTPTGGWTNTTYSGRWRRVGDTMELYVQAVLTASPVGNLNFSLPPGYTIDTTKLNSISSLSVGNGAWFDSVSTGIQMVAFNPGTTTIIPQGQRFAAASTNDLVGFTPTSPKTFVATDYVTGFARVPIVGWSSSVQTSDSTSTRVVACKTTAAVTSVISSGSLSTMNITGNEYDTHGMIGTNLITIPVSGEYKIDITCYTDNAATGAIVVNYSVNGVDDDELIRFPYNNTTGLTLSGNTTARFSAGDVFRLRALQNTGSTRNISFVVSLTRISGPSAIAANEVIAFRAKTAAGQSIPNNLETTVIFGTVDENTHGSYNPATGIFTAPASGLYALSSMITFTANATANRIAYYRVNSSYIGSAGISANTVGNRSSLNGATIFRLRAGDTVYLTAYQNTGASLTLFNNAEENYFSVHRIGN